MHHGARLPPHDGKNCSGVAGQRVQAFRIVLHPHLPHHLLSHVLGFGLGKVLWLYQFGDGEGSTDRGDVLWECEGLVDVLFEDADGLRKLLLVRVFSMALEYV